ncbi:hypothetical protein EJ05DRAFT_488794 [Pseudovirgaria hyperparasitica]|uniref:Uncharacterized protein n=1 Tax=Pseudovirgaria hyperparasitica TaxID=470096 RepID=A0A6A6VZV7_9PEZI|nr:uncharacterized protein EJ05DRAFT_488794 [Pseudovirgaria hyperparasitica]KAF2755274.1 hypothetical protein EJ05DRAFT_488794 [Pseudovirgaria hyperparasitica]
MSSGFFQNLTIRPKVSAVDEDPSLSSARHITDPHTGTPLNPPSTSITASASTGYTHPQGSKGAQLQEAPYTSYTTSNLLELGNLEVRAAIWGHVLSLPLDKTLILQRHVRDLGRPSTDRTALLRVCKEVYAEAVPLLYAQSLVFYSINTLRSWVIKVDINVDHLSSIVLRLQTQLGRGHYTISGELKSALGVSGLSRAGFLGSLALDGQTPALLDNQFPQYQEEGTERADMRLVHIVRRRGAAAEWPCVWDVEVRTLGRAFRRFKERQARQDGPTEAWAEYRNFFEIM